MHSETIRTDSVLHTCRGLVVVPVYNEARVLLDVISDLRGLSAPCDLLFVDDGSRDDSVKVLRNEQCDYVSHIVNLGYVEALRTGATSALRGTWDFVVFFDGDGQHRACDLDTLIRTFASASTKPDVIVGSRVLGGGGAATRLRRFGSWALRAISVIVAGVHVRDVTSGMKLLSKRGMRLLLDTPIEDGHAEFFVACAKWGLVVVEVPIRAKPRVAGQSMYHFWKAFLYPLRTFYLIFALALFTKQSKGR